jgi:hypothetical protein
LTPGFGIRDEKIFYPGSRKNMADHISESLLTIFGLIIFKFFVPDSRSGIRCLFDLDPGWKYSDPG